MGKLGQTKIVIGNRRERDDRNTMICVAHSLICTYSKGVKSTIDTTIGEFMDENKELIEHVYKEGLVMANYDFTPNQIQSAVLMYLVSTHTPHSPKDEITYLTMG